MRTSFFCWILALVVSEGIPCAHCLQLGKLPGVAQSLRLHAFPSIPRSARSHIRRDVTRSASDDDEAGEDPPTTEKVEVGSKEYLEGFLSSPIQDETVAERGSGLEQALKLGGGVTIVLVLLVVGFLASNGLL